MRQVVRDRTWSCRQATKSCSTRSKQSDRLKTRALSASYRRVTPGGELSSPARQYCFSRQDDKAQRWIAKPHDSWCVVLLDEFMPISSSVMRCQNHPLYSQK